MFEKFNSKTLRTIVFILGAGIMAAISKKEEIAQEEKIEAMEERIALLEKGDH